MCRIDGWEEKATRGEVTPRNLRLSAVALRIPNVNATTSISITGTS
jgi:hypothetical protein